MCMYTCILVYFVLFLMWEFQYWNSHIRKSTKYTSIQVYMHIWPKMYTFVYFVMKKYTFENQSILFHSTVKGLPIFNTLHSTPEPWTNNDHSKSKHPPNSGGRLQLTGPARFVRNWRKKISLNTERDKTISRELIGTEKSLRNYVDVVRYVL